MLDLEPVSRDITDFEYQHSHRDAATALSSSSKCDTRRLGNTQAPCVLRVWPHREGSVGFVPRKRSSEEAKWTEAEAIDNAISKLLNHWWNQYNPCPMWLNRGPWYWHPTICLQFFGMWDGIFQAVLETRSPGADNQAPITLSDLVNCHKEFSGSAQIKRKARGRLGYTSFNRKMIKSGLECLHRYWGKSKCSFVTLTMPELSALDLSVVLVSWRDITRRLYQEINREQKRLGLKVGYVGVTEIHLKRWGNTGKPYPHLHLVCQSRKRNRGDYMLRVEWMRATWRHILESVLGYELDQQPRVSMEYPRTSLQAEMAKYLSKCDEKTNEILTSDWAELMPHSWCSLSVNVKRWIAKNTFVYSGPVIGDLWQSARQMMESGVCFARNIYVERFETGSGKFQEYLIGLYLSWPSNQALREHLRALGIEPKKGFPLPQKLTLVRKGAVSRAA